MVKVYCDIVPADNGWIFLADGYHSPSYPSYDLALKAAAAYGEEREHRGQRVVLRAQNLRGAMSTIALNEAGKQTVETRLN